MTTLSAIEAAKRMNVHYETVLNLLGTGELPGAKIGRGYVLKEKDVDDYIEHQIQKQTAQRQHMHIAKLKQQLPHF